MLLTKASGEINSANLSLLYQAIVGVCIPCIHFTKHQQAYLSKLRTNANICNALNPLSIYYSETLICLLSGTETNPSCHWSNAGYTPGTRPLFHSADKTVLSWLSFVVIVVVCHDCWFLTLLHTENGCHRGT